MQAIASRTTIQREKSEQVRARAIVRFNGPLFYSLGAAYLLEMAAPLHVSRLAQVFAARSHVALWLERSWQTRRTETGLRLRGFLEATWPEFDWGAAGQEFHESYRPAPAGQGAGAALEALGQCVAAVQAAVFYRALARGADEPALRALAREAAQVHGESFDYFRDLFEGCARYERVGLLASWRALHAACRSARDCDVRAAFAPLGRHWKGAPTVPELGYGEFRTRMAQMIERHAGLGRAERLLFRTWLEPERQAPAPRMAEQRPERRPLLAPRPVAV